MPSLRKGRKHEESSVGKNLFVGRCDVCILGLRKQKQLPPLSRLPTTIPAGISLQLCWPSRWPTDSTKPYGRPATNRPATNRPATDRPTTNGPATNGATCLSKSAVPSSALLRSTTQPNRNTLDRPVASRAEQKPCQQPSQNACVSPKRLDYND